MVLPGDAPAGLGPSQVSICNDTVDLLGRGSPQGHGAEPHSPAGRAGAPLLAPLLAPPVPALVQGSPEAAVFLWRQTAWEGQQDKRLCGNRVGDFTSLWEAEGGVAL